VRFHRESVRKTASGCWSRSWKKEKERRRQTPNDKISINIVYIQSFNRYRLRDAQVRFTLFSLTGNLLLADPFCETPKRERIIEWDWRVTWRELLRVSKRFHYFLARFSPFVNKVSVRKIYGIVNVSIQGIKTSMDEPGNFKQCHSNWYFVVWRLSQSFFFSSLG